MSTQVKYGEVRDTPVNFIVSQMVEAGYPVEQKSLDFVKSLCDQYLKKQSLSPKQEYWLRVHYGRALGLEGGTEKSSPKKVEGLAAIHQFFDQCDLKYPKLVLYVPTLGDVKMHLAMKGKYQNKVVVTSNDKFPHAVWYGAIDATGVLTMPAKLDYTTAQRLKRILKHFADDPAEVAATSAKMSSKCCFCNSVIEDEKSLGVGYGPVCAKKWGLPWGAKAKK